MILIKSNVAVFNKDHNYFFSRKSSTSLPVIVRFVNYIKLLSNVSSWSTPPQKGGLWVTGDKIMGLSVKKSPKDLILY